MPSFGTPSGTTVIRSKYHGSGVTEPDGGMDGGLKGEGAPSDHGGVGLGALVLRQ